MTYTFLSNGTYGFQTIGCVDGGECGVITDRDDGTWENQGDDFNALSQTYIIQSTLGGRTTYNITFNSDFTEFIDTNNRTWIKQ